MNNIKLQSYIAYIGLIPALTVIFDLHFIGTLNEEIIRNFMIYYTIIIFTFIGAMIWDINVNGSMLITLYGTIPSLISFVLIVMNLIGFNYITIIQILITSLLLQLFFDSFVYLKSNVAGLRDFYYFVRFPVTLILSFLIILS
ncbi:MAG: hypothetical protein VX096_03670 [Pseudomonadota bacterium]|jgi:hypothetical protein|nr:hypothetical protein [Gammaproteobacteria bacterium]MBS55317.1 hypothetical protein [Gammaproteobacteria bacterium]MEC8086041.1 hypothetical protein [Pseudomonadota bacterium]GIS46381.1 MAG: hypothetical protein Ct9H90mP18_07130 [Gammaproteobacteria bacterium]|tara:strand:- start:519 stop:947 length:429 start_codon:yes stop_codon:yes gene_type:complete